MPEPITPPTEVTIVVHLDVETDTFAIHVGTATGLPEAYAATLGVGLLRAAASDVIARNRSVNGAEALQYVLQTYPITLESSRDYDPGESDFPSAALSCAELDRV